MSAAIGMKVEFHVGDACPNPLGEYTWEVEGAEQGFQKLPVDGVEGFAQINFHHTSRGDVFTVITPG